MTALSLQESKLRLEIKLNLNVLPLLLFDVKLLLSSFPTASGIRIYYTDRLRRHDTAMLLLGAEVNFLHLIPPLQVLAFYWGQSNKTC